MFLLGTLLSANAQVPSYVPSNGLVGWYPFSGNANDQSGNGNNGTVTGATLTTDRFGNSNLAYLFNGNSDFIEVSHNSSLILTSGVTFSFWLNITDSSLNSSGRLERQPIGKQVSATVSGLGFETTDATNPKLAPQFYLQGGVTYEHSSALSTNFWSHLVGTFDGTNLKLYQNGVLLGSNNGTFNLQSIVENLFFGKEGKKGLYFKGKLDDIGMWNRALTQQEITNLYNGNICYKSISVTDTLIINVKRTSLNPLAYANIIKVYPNPTKDKITIDNGDITKMTGYSIKIYNSIGQQLFQSNINQQQYSLDITQWGGNGLYFMEIKDNNGNIIDIKKIVLQ